MTSQPIVSCTFMAKLRDDQSTQTGDPRLATFGVITVDMYKCIITVRNVLWLRKFSSTVFKIVSGDFSARCC